MSCINNTKLFLAELKLNNQLRNMENFKEFLDIFPDASKEELLKENSALYSMDFTDLIEEYYEE